MPETNLIIELKIELSIPRKKGGNYVVSLRDVDLYSIGNNNLKELNVIIDDKPRGAGASGDKPRGAGAIGDKPRGAGGSGDKPRGAGGKGDKSRKRKIRK